MALNSHTTETGNTVEVEGYPPTAQGQASSGDTHAFSTLGVVFLILLILLTVAILIVLAWIGPVASGGLANATLAA